MRLIDSIPPTFVNSIDSAEIFSKKDHKFFESRLPVEQPPLGIPGESCHYNLFFGFFFDGTRNNYRLCSEADEEAKEQAEAGERVTAQAGCHSNVARLYDIYPGQSVPKVLPPESEWTHKPELYKHFFKVYTPGVGSPFAQIDDSGDGLFDDTLGAAAANNGSARIVWMLIQAINNVHRFLHQGAMLIGESEAKRLAKRIMLSAHTLRALTQAAEPHRHDGYPDPARSTREAFSELLTRLHEAVRHHWVNTADGKPARVDPGIVQGIKVSIFGFSRGATMARVFVNWLQALGRLDAMLCARRPDAPKPGATMSLGGFPFVIEFLGLFDTVASVGFAATLDQGPDGHGAWADAEGSMRVPPDVPCLHLVAAHEVRRSFPLDSVSVNNVFGANHVEWVMPGVHSDIGGGYAPREQGKGTSPTGDDMISRIALILMYREARLKGVPFKLELATDKAQQRFALSPQTIADYNAYLDACRKREDDPESALIGDHLFRQLREHYIQWRLLRRASGPAPLEQTASFLRASTFDQNDLRSANVEFEDEIKAFLTWRSRQNSHDHTKHQPLGFENNVYKEWAEISRWWDNAPPISPEMAAFFDNHVHDSRAWFKIFPGNPDNEKEMREQLDKWVRRIRQYERHQRQHGRHNISDGLTAEQRAVALDYDATGELPVMRTKGREPFTLARAGYLRYRKIYSGADTYLISRAAPRAAPPIDRPHVGMSMPAESPVT